jgi:hypothetical protein
MVMEEVADNAKAMLDKSVTDSRTVPICLSPVTFD